MKSILTLFGFLFVLTCAGQQKQPVTFTLSDSTFTVGAILQPTCAVWFNLDSHYYVRSESKPCLDSIALFIKKHPGIIIEIGSYTDQRGSDSTNNWWSQRRAERIRDHLLTRGVSPLSVVAVGYGESHPIVKESEILKIKNKPDREPLYAQNRRTEFKILRSPLVTFELTDTVFTLGAYLIRPINYQLGQATLDTACFPFLDSLARLLLVHPELQIKISTHLDSRWNPASSSNLSARRARTVADYLFSKGVPATQVIPVGYNDTQLIVPDTLINSVPGKAGKEALHAVNRRTEIRIINIQ